MKNISLELAIRITSGLLNIWKDQLTHQGIWLTIYDSPGPSLSKMLNCEFNTLIFNPRRNPTDTVTINLLKNLLWSEQNYIEQIYCVEGLVPAEEFIEKVSDPDIFALGLKMDDQGKFEDWEILPIVTVDAQPRYQLEVLYRGCEKPNLN